MGIHGKYWPLVSWLNRLAGAETAKPARFNIGGAGFCDDDPVATVLFCLVKRFVSHLDSTRYASFSVRVNDRNTNADRKISGMVRTLVDNS